MPPLSTIGLILSLIEYGWKAFQFIRGKIGELEYQACHASLEKGILAARGAHTPEEKQHAAQDLARAHRDILN